jgi:hypothetical protein
MTKRLKSSKIFAEINWKKPFFFTQNWVKKHPQNKFLEQFFTQIHLLYIFLALLLASQKSKNY